MKQRSLPTVPPRAGGVVHAGVAVAGGARRGRRWRRGALAAWRASGRVGRRAVRPQRGERARAAAGLPRTRGRWWLV